MLRRPPTTLSLTAEDIASYEDRRERSGFIQPHAAQHFHSDISHAHPNSSVRHGRQHSDMISQEGDMQENEEMELSSAASASPFGSSSHEEEEDEDDRMEDAEEEEQEQLVHAPPAQSSLPQPTAPMARRQPPTAGRTQSNPQTNSRATQAAGRNTASASARIMGAGATTPGGPSGGGSGGSGGSGYAQPPAAPTRATRSRDERIGVSAPPSQIGTGAGTTRRR